MRHWIRAVLPLVVRLNVASQKEALPIERYREIRAVDISPDAITQISIRRCLPDARASSDTDRVLSILFNARFRRGPRSLVEAHRETFLRIIARTIDRFAPIELILPALPFKCQNPLSTRHSIGFTDLGEWLMFCQLRDLIMSIRQAYEPGARMIVLSDGIVYADIFAAGLRDIPAITRYRESCRAITNTLGLSDAVTLVDMSDVVRRFADFGATRLAIRDALTDLDRSDPAVSERLCALRRGMLLNVPLPGYDLDDVARFASGKLMDLPHDVAERVTSAAFDYASFLLTMQRLEVIAKSFPTAIRTTSHPKPAAQFPLHLVNARSGVAPHNGIPIISQNALHGCGGDIRHAARIMRIVDALALPGLTAGYIPRDSEPFCYFVE